MTLDDLISFLNEGLETGTEIGTETELFSSGLVDSVRMMNLIMFIEEKARITVQPDEVTLENLDTPRRIMAFVESKQ